MSIEENKELVTEFWKRFSALDLEGAFAMMADDSTWWVGGEPDKFPLAGQHPKVDMLALLEGLKLLAPNGVTITPTAFTAEGNRVAVECSSYGETSTGKIYDNKYHFLFEFKDGQITAVKEYLDTMHTNYVFCT